MHWFILICRHSACYQLLKCCIRVNLHFCVIYFVFISIYRYSVVLKKEFDIVCVVGYCSLKYIYRRGRWFTENERLKSNRIAGNPITVMFFTLNSAFYGSWIWHIAFGARSRGHFCDPLDNTFSPERYSCAISIDVSTTCISGLPPTNTTKKPTVNYKLTKRSGQRQDVEKIEFECSFPTLGDNNIYYEVYWYLNDRLQKVIDPVTEDNLILTRLTEDNGLKIGVQVRAPLYHCIKIQL